MTWFVYLLYSESKNRHYVGYTNDLKARLQKHNSDKGAKYTRTAHDWVILYSEEFETKEEAMSYEYKVKSSKKLRNQLYQKAHSLTN